MQNRKNDPKRNRPTSNQKPGKNARKRHERKRTEHAERNEARAEKEREKAERQRRPKPEKVAKTQEEKRFPKRGPDAPPTKSQVPEITEPVRLNRFISMAGIAARRKADEMIAEGRVKLNGQVVTEMGTKVGPDDEVAVDGKVITPQGLVYILLNKPGDTVTTVDDERDRRTVMDLLDDPELDKAGLFPVGRLDRQTLGVLLLTNDGELANRLMHPRYEVDKLYLVKTKDAVKPHQLDELTSGIMLEDGMAKADRVAYINPPSHHEIGISLHEGRNRQIRRMLEALGHDVVHLERVNYAGLTADDVRRGKWRHLFPHEVRKLKHQVKLK